MSINCEMFSCYSSIINDVELEGWEKMYENTMTTNLCNYSRAVDGAGSEFIAVFPHMLAN